MTKAEPHQVFVDAWRAFGEVWLFDDGIPSGSNEAWYKLSHWNGGRWWDDERLPPELQARPTVFRPELKPWRPPQRILPTIPGRFAELVGWPWEQNDHLTLWERWHADPKRFGLEPEPLLWWETDLVKEEEWPKAA